MHTLKHPEIPLMQVLPPMLLFQKLDLVHRVRVVALQEDQGPSGTLFQVVMGLLERVLLFL